MNDAARNELASRFGDIASEAGKVIMAIYSPTLKVDAKKDSSPVTEADAAAERVILQRLKEVIPGVPVVAEESFDAKTNGSAPARFILVDPLDGTREFITGSHEFTVNIALIENGKPVVGCVYAPALNQMYIAGAGAWRAEVRPGDAVPEARSHAEARDRALSRRRACARWRAARTSIRKPRRC